MYDKHGMHIDLPRGQRSMPRLLKDYAGESMLDLEEKAESGLINSNDLMRLKLARNIRGRLSVALCNPKDLTACRAELIEELMKPEEEGGLGITNDRQAYKIIASIMAEMAEARKVDKAVHRMVLAERNQIAWQMAREKGDLAGMNAADANYIKINQLDTPDEVKLDPDAIFIPNVLGTVRYSDISDTPYEDPREAIRRAEKIAKSGIIDLKEGDDYTITDMAEYKQLREAEEAIQEKPL